MKNPSKSVPVFKGAPPKVPTGSPPPPPPPTLHTVKRVAEVLDASQRFVQGEIATGRLRVVRLGRLVRVDPQDLNDYVAARKHGGLIPITTTPVAPLRTTPSGGADA